MQSLGKVTSVGAGQPNPRLHTYLQYSYLQRFLLLYRVVEKGIILAFSIYNIQLLLILGNLD